MRRARRQAMKILDFPRKHVSLGEANPTSATLPLKDEVRH
jgi:hypothetical protein